MDAENRLIVSQDIMRPMSMNQRTWNRKKRKGTIAAMYRGHLGEAPPGSAQGRIALIQDHEYTG
jgi:hypothetical protein